MMTGEEILVLESAFEALIADRAHTFKDAITAWRFVRMIVRLGRKLGAPMSPLDGWEDVPDWITELPGGSYDLELQGEEEP